MRTASLWGPPPSRFYRFLNTVSGAVPAKPLSLAVLGCADGKFVLPAARRGARVLAVDSDEKAILGGFKEGVGGQVWMPGLNARLHAEGLKGEVEVVVADFLQIEPKPCEAVLVSGALQYSRNLPRSAAEMLDTVLKFVGPAGFFYLDYMLPFEAKYKGRKNCPEAAWWRTWVGELSEWDVLHHRVLPPVMDKAHVEFPTDHLHQWGHLFLRRKQ